MPDKTNTMSQVKNVNLNPTAPSIYLCLMSMGQPGSNLSGIKNKSDANDCNPVQIN
jgi:hypothetical protein